MPEIRRFTYPSALKFFIRYPIFLLGFGPPIFRSQTVDATTGVTDFWSVLQIGWLTLITLRAIYRLLAAQQILIPKQIRAIFRLTFFLGLLFLISVAYSPSRLVSAAYAVFYFLTLICVIEFVADAYQDPPIWVECLFHLRFIALFLFLAVVLVLPFSPQSVMMGAPGLGIRFLGGSLAPMPVICPIIAIISAYTFLHSLESRTRAAFFFFVGLGATLATQLRGAEIALLVALLLIAMDWARTGRHAAYMVIFGLMASLVLGSVLVGGIGGERIWNIFNKGQNTEGIQSASGRTEIWNYVIQYCISYPQGMGYVAGFRMLFKNYFSLTSAVVASRIGNTHNTFLQYLADAGWAALVIYLIMLAKVLALGFRVAAKRTPVSFDLDSTSRHALRCTLVLLIYFLVEGVDISDFAAPLRIPFFLQNIAIAIILGVSARIIAASRIRPT
jgi:hypothetical protein